MEEINKKVPEFLQEMLYNQYGENVASSIIRGYLKKRKTTLRVNTLKSDIQKIEKELDKNEIIYKNVDWYTDAFIIENVKEDIIKKLEIFETGEIYLQSLSSMIPPILLNPRKGENILDMAAAPGGKTTQMAALSNNEAMITACEKNKIRGERLNYNLEKQGATRVNVMIEDARYLSDYFSFDKILLDAPCSGSGTLCFEDENINNNFSQELIERSVKAQEKLLEKALRILKPKGEIIYSTCSILAKENEDILQKILNKYRAEIMPIGDNMVSNIPTLPVKIKGTLCVCPTELYEGFFVAKIRKNG